MTLSLYFLACNYCWQAQRGINIRTSFETKTISQTQNLYKVGIVLLAMLFSSINSGLGMFCLFHY